MRFDPHPTRPTTAPSNPSLPADNRLGAAGAKATALGYVQTGRAPEYVPSYWAGYADEPDCPHGWACDGSGKADAPHWLPQRLSGSGVGGGRRAFYLRDMAHHALGAHLLGLDNENANMARIFAASASKARGYFPVWSFGFDGSVYPMDYINDTCERASPRGLSPRCPV